MRYLVFLIWVVSLSSCASMGTRQLANLDYPLLTIRKGIKKALPVEFQYISKDGREYRSLPFVRDGKKLKEARNENERGVGLIEIRGTKRPYSVDVTVLIEEAQTPNSVQKNFQVTGYDEVVASIILARLKAYLYKSKTKGNVIDDFKVF